MKTDVAKHEGVTQKHLKSSSDRTHTVVYWICCITFHGSFNFQSSTASCIL